MGATFERLTGDDDWPPIFSVNLSADVDSDSLEAALQYRADSPSFERAVLNFRVEEGGLSAVEITRIAAPYASSMTVEYRETEDAPPWNSEDGGIIEEGF